jgi:hypothetical protein
MGVQEKEHAIEFCRLDVFSILTGGRAGVLSHRQSRDGCVVFIRHGYGITAPLPFFRQFRRRNRGARDRFLARGELLVRLVQKLPRLPPWK